MGEKKTEKKKYNFTRSIIFSNGGIFKLTSNELGRGGLNKYNKFHLLQPSIWPFLASLAVFFLVYGLLYWFYMGKVFSVFFGIFQVTLIMFFWWRDVSSESGEHTPEVDRGLKIGMALFILSEVMFFFSFFWAFFHLSLVPAIELGGVWPPIGLQDLVINPWGIPLLNTFLLLGSGVTVTCAHHAFLIHFKLEKFLAKLDSRELSKFINFRRGFSKIKLITFEDFSKYTIELKKSSLHHLLVGIDFMIFTIVFALAFTILQIYEYIESLIRISDGVYGSTFFVMTGFHGLHVIIGTIFLIVSLVRIINNQFYYKQSVGLECAIWYWHFVDVVWLFLFLSIYVWGNSKPKNDDCILFFDSHKADFYWSLGNPSIFQDPATSAMEGLVDLHHNIIFFLIVIFIVVCWMLFNVVYHVKFSPKNDGYSVWDLQLNHNVYNKSKFFKPIKPTPTIIQHIIKRLGLLIEVIQNMYGILTKKDTYIEFILRERDKDIKKYAKMLTDLQLKQKILIFGDLTRSYIELVRNVDKTIEEIKGYERIVTKNMHPDRNQKAKDYELNLLYYDTFIPIDEL